MTTGQKKTAEITELNLTQAAQGLKRLNASIAWAFNPYGGKPMDVDFSCFILGRDGQTREDEDFVFYNNPQGAALAVKHGGDSQPVGGGGPTAFLTETIEVDLDNLSFDIWRIAFVLSVYQGVENDQSFDVLREAVFKIENADGGQELARITFSGEAVQNGTAIRLAEIARDGVEWHFKALKDPVAGGLAEIARGYGILISSTT